MQKEQKKVTKIGPRSDMPEKCDGVYNQTAESPGIDAVASKRQTDFLQPQLSKVQTTYLSESTLEENHAIRNAFVDELEQTLSEEGSGKQSGGWIKYFEQLRWEVWHH